MLTSDLYMYWKNKKTSCEIKELLLFEGTRSDFIKKNDYFDVIKNY